MVSNSPLSHLSPPLARTNFDAQMQSRGSVVSEWWLSNGNLEHTQISSKRLMSTFFSLVSSHLSPSLTVNKSVSPCFSLIIFSGVSPISGPEQTLSSLPGWWFTRCHGIIGTIWHHQTQWPATLTLFRNIDHWLLERLTSASRECRFINSSVSNFSFWFGTTRGILKRNLGFVGGTSAWVCGCWLWLGWWPGLGCPNISPWCPPVPGPGCWAAGWWPKGNMLKEDGAALCSMAAPLTVFTRADHCLEVTWPGQYWPQCSACGSHHTPVYWLSGWENHRILSPGLAQLAGGWAHSGVAGVHSLPALYDTAAVAASRITDSAATGRASAAQGERRRDGSECWARWWSCGESRWEPDPA